MPNWRFGRATDGCQTSDGAAAIRRSTGRTSIKNAAPARRNAACRGNIAEAGKTLKVIYRKSRAEPAPANMMSEKGPRRFARETAEFIKIARMEDANNVHERDVESVLFREDEAHATRPRGKEQRD